MHNPQVELTSALRAREALNVGTSGLLAGPGGGHNTQLDVRYKPVDSRVIPPSGDSFAVFLI